MRTEPRREAEGPGHPALLVALAESASGALAVCDDGLFVVAMSPMFRALLGVERHHGVLPLAQVLPELPERLRGGQQGPWVCRDRGGTSWPISVERHGAHWLLKVERESARSLAPPFNQGILVELGHEIAAAVTEDELVAVIARGVKRLFPGASFCVRIVERRTLELTSVYAEGALGDSPRDVLVLERRFVERARLNVAELPQGKLEVRDSGPPLLFVDSSHGLTVPLVAAGELFGAITVELSASDAARVDESLLWQACNQVAVGVRNAKLIDELTFLRGYFEDLVEHANALILVTDAERRVVVFNRALELLTGISRAEVLGEDLITLLPEDERLRVGAAHAASLRGTHASGLETRLLSRDGEPVSVSISTSGVFSTPGRIEGVIAIGQDLTKMRELEQRVIQAERLSSVGRLAASVVHEINNPMTSVLGYAEALLTKARRRVDAGGEAAPAGELEKLERIIAAAERVLDFTRELMSYARPSEARPELVDLAALIDQAIGFCAHLLEESGVRVERAYADLPRISAIRKNVVQVFVNLITNACHASPPGSVVTIRGAVLGEGEVEGEVLIQVQDEGAGIPPELLDRIFEPFVTTKPAGKGTGLGLSIVQAILHRHGGRIEVASTGATGTTFEVRLPIVRLEPLSEAQTPPATLQTPSRRRPT